MSFSETDYQAAAKQLDAPVAHVKAMAAVESAGETFWTLDGKRVVPVRFEAHWFGKLTGYRYNASHPGLSCAQWNPVLAACTRAGAWAQLRLAAALDEEAAVEATSWGAFQVMGFHWRRLGYDGIEDFVSAMQTAGGQLDAFVRFIEADPALRAALAAGAWLDVERRYNGGGYGGAYAAKLEEAATLYAYGSTTPRTLRLGDSGVDVVALQRTLDVEADGYFGPSTDAAVRALQARHGLVVDGIAGRMTRAALDLEEATERSAA